MKIYTLTLNPAYDVHGAADSFASGAENFVSVISRDAGGKGVNISRALRSAGIANTAVVVTGRENSAEFRESLSSAGLNVLYLEREGRIRENLTIHHGKEETRISFAGFAVEDALLEDVYDCLDVDADTVVTFTGSIPEGVSKAAAVAFLQKLKDGGAKLVVDCRSFDLTDIQQIRPWLIKPNRQELSQWVNAPIENLGSAIYHALNIHNMGIQNVMVTMGEQGAALAGNRVYTACVPAICALSTIGAGDSSIAGFISAFADGCQEADCLARAVAFGTAACLTAGTLPPRREDIESILPNIKISEVSYAVSGT